MWERACSRRQCVGQNIQRLTHRFREQARSHTLELRYQMTVVDQPAKALAQSTAQPLAGKSPIPDLIVPTLRVGTHPVTLRVTALKADAERPTRHSHAERGNDQPAWCAASFLQNWQAAVLVYPQTQHCDTKPHPPFLLIPPDQAKYPPDRLTLRIIRHGPSTLCNCLDRLPCSAVQCVCHAVGQCNAADR
ncbi:hypothetical protein B4O85_02330 [Pseudomonas azotoformans]|uniref:Uncharacterized protein n=1 Tax=Pseudomonas azotoformans TaxID=47878 RepID=A0A4Q0HZT3_PSEAZ|nr:hypothetical protein B4O85_02330 [Pseudomonas azotoformans]